MSWKDKARLFHIRDAAHEAIEFVEDLTQEEFKRDRLRSLAVVRLLETIGEAARAVSKELRRKQPEIRWSQMIGMRDRLIHGYDDVDLDVVWHTIRGDLPDLLVQIERLVADPLD